MSKALTMAPSHGPLPVSRCSMISNHGLLIGFVRVYRVSNRQIPQNCMHIQGAHNFLYVVLPISTFLRSGMHCMGAVLQVSYTPLSLNPQPSTAIRGEVGPDYIIVYYSVL